MNFMSRMVQFEVAWKAVREEMYSARFLVYSMFSVFMALRKCLIPRFLLSVSLI